MRKSKQALSVLLATLMLLSVVTAVPLTAGAAAANALPDLSEATQGIDEWDLNTYYFYMPDEWKNDSNDRFATEDEAPVYAAGIYYWQDNDIDGEYAVNWPGYAVTETTEEDGNIYVAPISADIDTIVFNNTVAQGEKSFRTDNINTQWYDPGDEPYGFYPDGTLDLNGYSFDGMIYVCDPQATVTSTADEIANTSLARGAWFFYFNDGTYSYFPTREEAEAHNALFSGGEFPRIVKDTDFSYEANKDGTAEVTGYYGTNTHIVIPDSLDDYQITSIGDGAFEGRDDFVTAYIPEGVTAIGASAFSGCSNLSAVTIPQSLEVIGDSAFSGCDALENVYYGGTEAQWQDILMGDDNDALYFATINYSPGESEIPDLGITAGGVTGDCYWFFMGSTGTFVLVGEGATEDYEEEITPWDYYKGDIRELVVYDGVTKIGVNAFQMCNSLISVTLPDTLDTLSMWAFYGCENLKEVNIGAGTSDIDSAAFLDCFNLSEINVDSANEFYTSANGNLYTKDRKTLVQYAPGKKAGAFVIPGTVETVGDYAFSNCMNLERITIPESVKTIGEGAFQFCVGLNEITIPDSVTEFGSFIFAGCSCLTSVKLPQSLTALGEYMFFGCASLEAIDIPQGVETIGDGAFISCESLSSVTVPDGLTSIGESAFASCIMLSSIDLPDSITSIGIDAFDSCGLTSVKIPSGVTVLDEYVFSWCMDLEIVVIPDSVTYIGLSAFDECEALKDVYYQGSREQWENIGIDEFNDYLLNADIHFESTGPDDTKPTEPTATEPVSTQPTETKPIASEPVVTLPAVVDKPDISTWDVSGIKNKTYTGSLITQSVTVTKNGEKATVSLSYKNNLTPGTATVIITGTGKYTGTITKTFKITKAKQPMTAKATVKKAKASALKNGKMTVKAITAKKAQGKVTYKKISGSKKFKVNSTTGKITIKKGSYKKGTYKIKVRVTAKGNGNYKRGSRTVTVRVKVK